MMIELNEDLEVLSFAQDKSVTKIEHLPSWVLDYSLRGTNPLLATISALLIDCFFHPNVRPASTTWNELALSGVEFDLSIIQLISGHWDNQT